MARLTDEQKAFLRDNAYYGVITTLRPDGSPHTTVVWVDVDDNGDVWVNTAHGRAKPRHLAQDPRLSLTVVNPENGYHWVSLSGTGELIDEGADAQIDKLAKKYLNEDSYPWRKPDEQRVGIRITPQTVDSSGFDGGH
jgi:PPOX class probable F420-dependent enzyme